MNNKLKIEQLFLLRLRKPTSSLIEVFQKLRYFWAIRFNLVSH